MIKIKSGKIFSSLLSLFIMIVVTFGALNNSTVLAVDNVGGYGTPANNVGGYSGGTNNVGGYENPSRTINNSASRTVKTGEIQNVFAFRSVQELLQKILSIVVKIGTPIAVFFIIYAGFKYVLAAGNTSKISEAHETFLGALIGTAILIGAQVISMLLANTAQQIVG